MRIPILETERLIIRPFTMDDLDTIHQILDVELHFTSGDEQPHTFEERKSWLQWSVMNEEQLAALFQPPYGDRAVVRREDLQLIGSCGFVPCLEPFGQLPRFGGGADSRPRHHTRPEVGLFYALSPACWGKGYATEASRAMVEYGFKELRLERIVATTEHANTASIAVMRRLGMRIEQNPSPDPPWFQVVGVIENRE